jgi:hypothetical protein
MKSSAVPPEAVAAAQGVSAERLAAMGGSNVMAPLGSSLLGPPGPPGALLSPSIPPSVAGGAGGVAGPLVGPSGRGQVRTGVLSASGRNRMHFGSSGPGLVVSGNGQLSHAGLVRGAKPHLPVLANRHMSGSETDVSTSMENLTQVNKTNHYCQEA